MVGRHVTITRRFWHPLPLAVVIATLSLVATAFHRSGIAETAPWLAMGAAAGFSVSGST
ncbi:hypothetical protein [Nonomuraea turcica]|uniref:hypothetical protein n=1 Tax=Nonomuraea sp. G32 TaxID=3067274 RepID=UPI00273BFBF5|nr:hypothetical protein [Nonomuraea sp. G32]MDP4506849.1 hypothetical protein [Nonomuraea sp. G32]